VLYCIDNEILPEKVDNERQGYYVSTVGSNEDDVSKYIREQEMEDKRLDELGCSRGAMLDYRL
jgi:hypothetical protein